MYVQINSSNEKFVTWIGYILGEGNSIRHTNIVDKI